MEQGIEQHGTMAGRENEPVTIGPSWLIRIMAEIEMPQDKGIVGRPHWQAGMARIRLLNGIGRQHFYGIHRDFGQVVVNFYWGHLIYLLLWWFQRVESGNGQAFSGDESYLNKLAEITQEYFVGLHPPAFSLFLVEIHDFHGFPP
jgi:hypothetical protein